MTLLADIRNFFVRERLWGFLFLLAAAIYGTAVWRGRAEVQEPPSSALEMLKTAEHKLKEEIHSVGGVQMLLRRRPRLLTALNLFTFLVFGIFLTGLWIDYYWVTRPAWRQGLGKSAGPPEAGGWGPSTIFKVILIFILAGVGLNGFLTLLRSVFFPGLGQNLFILVHTTLSDLVCVGAVVYFITRRGGNWRDLGFKGVRFFKDMGVGLAGYAGLVPIFVLSLVAVVLAAQWLSYEPPPHPLVEVFLEEEKRAPGVVLYSLFLACVAGPLFEEIFFRGFCYPALKKRWGMGTGLVLSAAFFALIHQNAFAFFPIFILGLGLGYLYEKRGTLIPSIVLHVVHNSIFVGYFFLAKEVLIGS
ncbi:MAG: CPBP family intramembrane metalloprotease [Candidatus Omnitrophica bacterium]|nr:CPBP family intramembrane metalloprotease [Candidatus Omnitrophota bacterium]